MTDDQERQERRDRAMKGWIADPPPPKEWNTSSRYKWYKMMGVAHLIPDTSPREITPTKET